MAENKNKMMMPCMCLIVVLLILTLSATCISNIEKFEPYFPDSLVQYITGDENKGEEPHIIKNDGRLGSRPNSSRPNSTRPNSSRPNSSRPSVVKNPDEEFLSSNLLPKNGENSDVAFDFAPKDLQNMNFLDATTRIGVDTVSSSLRNANYGLRSEPMNPKTAVSPWMNSDIDPDLARRPLET
tara:strand:+ start:10562 stop:11110 length:549 start_codon:yes stop_codon:yes gene_type:complete